jgi:hypothetical protein
MDAVNDVPFRHGWQRDKSRVSFIGKLGQDAVAKNDDPTLDIRLRNRLDSSSA